MTLRTEVSSKTDASACLREVHQQSEKREEHHRPAGAAKDTRKAQRGQDGQECRHDPARCQPAGAD